MAQTVREFIEERQNAWIDLKCYEQLDYYETASLEIVEMEHGSLHSDEWEKLKAEVLEKEFDYCYKKENYENLNVDYAAPKEYFLFRVDSLMYAWARGRNSHDLYVVKRFAHDKGITWVVGHIDSWYGLMPLHYLEGDDHRLIGEYYESCQDRNDDLLKDEWANIDRPDLMYRQGCPYSSYKLGTCKGGNIGKLRIYKRVLRPFTRDAYWISRPLEDCDGTFLPYHVREALKKDMFEYRPFLLAPFTEFCERFPINTELKKPMSKKPKKIKIY